MKKYNIEEIFLIRAIVIMGTKNNSTIEIEWYYLATKKQDVYYDVFTKEEIKDLPIEALDRYLNVPYIISAEPFKHINILKRRFEIKELQKWVIEKNQANLYRKFF